LNFNGGNETPRDVIASFEGGAKAVGGDPRGAAVLRVLRGAEALQGFPTLLHFALLLIAEFLQFAPLRGYLLRCGEAGGRRPRGAAGLGGGGPIPPRGRVVGLAQEPPLPTNTVRARP
jgi:hypothetical protein